MQQRSELRLKGETTDTHTGPNREGFAAAWLHCGESPSACPYHIRLFISRPKPSPFLSSTAASFVFHSPFICPAHFRICSLPTTHRIYLTAKLGAGSSTCKAKPEGESRKIFLLRERIFLRQSSSFKRVFSASALPCCPPPAFTCSKINPLQVGKGLKEREKNKILKTQG